jgi:hypothetical protein
MNHVLTKQTTKEIIQKALAESMCYEQFRQLVSELAAKNGTTGPEQTEAYKDYTVLNDKRMRRWDKTLKFPEDISKHLKGYREKVYWLVIVESWCGDSAPSLPVMNKIASLNDAIDLRIVLRNEQPRLMDAFLTNEKMAIPKLIAIDQKTLGVLGTWGPLPTIATKMANEYKQEHGALSPEFKEALQQWFNKDKGKNILTDLQQLLALK